jgi:hypothetical protein
VPHQVKQPDRAQHLTAVPDQGHEQAVLGRGQLHGHAVGEYFVRGEVHPDAAVVVGVRLLLLAAPRPPEQRPHPGDELRVAERLGDVIIGAGPQAAHLVRLLAVRGEHEHGNLTQLADPLQDSPPVHLREPDVQDHDVRALAVKRAQAFPAVARRGHREPVPAQRRAHAERDVPIVLDQQHPVCHWAAAAA